MARQPAHRLGRRQFLGSAGATAALGLHWPLAAARGSASAAVEVELEARATDLTLAGTPVRLLTYNGLFPGPLLRAREGQTLRVRLVNRLDEPTNLHFHGLHVSPAANHDNVSSMSFLAGASPTS